MLVEVKQEHIDGGCRADNDNCPIHHALRDFIRDEYTVSVNTEVVEVTGEFLWQESYTLRLPPEAREFIQRFDYGRTVEPFSFHLPMPSRILL